MLDSRLIYETSDGVVVYIRAEVGLLSRNVVFNAINDNTIIA